MSDTTNFPPRPVPNAQVREIDLTGYIFPWQDGAPVLVALDGTNDYFLPVFSSVEKLRESVEVIAIQMDAIKRIDDGPAFLASGDLSWHTGQRLRIMTDPLRTSEGITRFTEVIRDNNSELAQNTVNRD